MNWLDIKLLTAIGASAVVGVVATAALLTHPVEVGPFDQAVRRGSIAVIHIPSETSNVHHADLTHWWEREAPIRFSGPGAMGLGQRERSRRRSGFRLKDPPRHLGFERPWIRYSIERPDLSNPKALGEYQLQIRPLTKR